MKLELMSHLQRAIDQGALPATVTAGAAFRLLVNGVIGVATMRLSNRLSPAETKARVMATPVERGTAVSAGSELVRLSATETEAQLNEAEANASQIEARLGLAPGEVTAALQDRADLSRARTDIVTSRTHVEYSARQNELASVLAYDLALVAFEALRQAAPAPPAQ